MNASVSRRDFLALAASTLVPAHAAVDVSHQATGVKVGEITPNSALIWARRTKASLRRADGIEGVEHVTLPLDADISQLEGACPGDEGEIRVIVNSKLGHRVAETAWAPALPAADYATQFPVASLQPASAYAFTVETRASGRVDGRFSGVFRTSMAEDAREPVEFAMLSCQKYEKRDDSNGYFIYDAIRSFAPHFYLSVGDNVYYDSDFPVVNSEATARHHWNRMFSMSRLVECTRAVPCYWMKDDHDSYSNDDWPGFVDKKMLPFTWQQGVRLFPQQVPFPTKPYRALRWGRALEVFLLEGRDFRSANTLPDGPTKTIWGPVQREWLKQSIARSRADWKIVVSPTPIVGPDRPGKNDNHANAAFRHEGDEIRRWVAENTHQDTFFFNGDRHWQYHSIDPSTKVEEFSCGPTSDAHAEGSPGYDPKYHRFHRVKGGFIAATVLPGARSSKLVIEHRDVHGKTVYSKTFDKSM